MLVKGKLGKYTNKLGVSKPMVVVEDNNGQEFVAYLGKDVDVKEKIRSFGSMANFLGALKLREGNYGKFYDFGIALTDSEDLSSLFGEIATNSMSKEDQIDSLIIQLKEATTERSKNKFKKQLIALGLTEEEIKKEVVA